MKEAYNLLKRAMRSACLVHYVPFQELLENLKQSGADFLRQCNL